MAKSFAQIVEAIRQEPDRDRKSVLLQQLRGSSDVCFEKWQDFRYAMGHLEHWAWGKGRYEQAALEGMCELAQTPAQWLKVYNYSSYNLAIRLTALDKLATAGLSFQSWLAIYNEHPIKHQDGFKEFPLQRLALDKIAECDANLDELLEMYGTTYNYFLKPVIRQLIIRSAVREASAPTPPAGT